MYPRFALRAATLTVLLAAILPASVWAQQSISFSRTSYSSQPFDIAVADFNHDGFADIISTVGGGGNTVTLMINNHNGTFTPPGQSFKAVQGEVACGIAVGDLNGDGKTDVVVGDCTDTGGSSTNGQGNAIDILYGTSGGSFQQPVAIAVPGQPTSIVIADFNRDGKRDIAVALNGSAKLAVLMNRGSGKFSAPYKFLNTATYGNIPSSMTSGDINGDGKQDLAMVVCCVDSNTHANVVRLLNTTATGSSTPSFSSALVEKGTATTVTLVDIDGNGRADYLIPFYPNGSCQAVHCSTIQGVSWIFNNQDGTRTKSGYSFAVDSKWEVGQGAIAADLNGDGIKDIAILVGSLDNTSETVRYLLGTGSRHFTTSRTATLASGYWPFRLVSADLDHNRLFDLIVSGMSAPAVSKAEVLLSHKQ